MRPDGSFSNKTQRYGYTAPIELVSSHVYYVDDLDPRVAVEQGASILRDRWKVPIRAAIISGSGFSHHTQVGTVVDRIPYSSIPGLPQSAVKGHGSEAVLLSTQHGNVLLFTGRTHAYEGNRPSICAAHVALAMRIGVKNVVLTNACGGLHPSLKTGDVLITSDVLNLAYRSIRVENNVRTLVIQPDWWRRLSVECCRQGIPVKAGTYAQVRGPSYETRAEIRMLRRIGADVVGMSTVVEAAWAASKGANVSIVSLVTNVLTDAKSRPVTHSEVVSVAESVREKVSQILLVAIATSERCHEAP